MEGVRKNLKTKHASQYLKIVDMSDIIRMIVTQMNNGQRLNPAQKCFV